MNYFQGKTDGEARRDAAQAALRHWAHHVDAKHIWPKHLGLLERALDRVETGECKRLIVTMPPRHGKSETISGKFPSYFIGKNPERRVILTSHTASLAIDFAVRNRTYLNEFGPEIFGVCVDPNRAKSDDWKVEGHEGGIRAAGVGGSITGRGANLLIVDDPFKDFADAHSKTIREHVWNWWTTVALTRLEPDGAVVVVSTRWHEDDLVGRILKAAKQTGEVWEVINFPALAVEGDPLGREPGQALWPDRFTARALRLMRQTMGSYKFNALYQQGPSAPDGNVFKRSWFRCFRDTGSFYELVTPDGIKRVNKRDCWLFQTVDPAATQKDSSDYFVCGTWAVTPESDLLLVDVFRERLETPKHRILMQSLYERYKPKLQGVEKATYGLALIQEMKGLGLPVTPLDADRDKVARAYPIAARYETGSVYHRQGAPWVGDYEDELQTFPNGAHDDQVDVASYAAVVLADKSGDKLDPGAAELLRSLRVHS